MADKPKKTELVDIIAGWYAKAKHIRHFWDIVGDIARQVRAGQPDADTIQGDRGLDVNHYVISSERKIGRCIESEPRPQISPKPGNKDKRDKELAEEIKSLMEAKVANQQLMALLEAAQYDDQDYGLGYWVMDLQGNVRYKPYVDVYVDNGKAQWWDVSEGRFVIIRETSDRYEFFERFKSVLVSNGIKAADELEAASSLPGREFTGIWLTGNWQREEDTRLSRSNRQQAATSGDGDDLIEWFKVYLLDPDAESGWKEHYFFAGGSSAMVLESHECPWWMPYPRLYVFSQTTISNTFYQPSAFLYIEKMMSGINWFWRKVLGTVDMIDFPPWLIPTNLPGIVDSRGNLIKKIRGVKGENVVTASNNPGDKPEVMNLPTVPNQYFGAIHQITETAEKQTGDTEPVQGAASKMSGIAIQEEKESASVRQTPMLKNQAQTLKRFGRDMALVCYYNMIQEEYFRDFKEKYPDSDDEEIQIQVEALIDGDIEGFESLSPEQQAEIGDPMQIREDFYRIANNLQYDFLITPYISRGQKIGMLIEAASTELVVQLSMSPAQAPNEETGVMEQVMQPDPVLGLKIAAYLADVPRIADGIQGMIDEYRQEQAQNEQLTPEEEQAAQEDALAELEGEEEGNQVVEDALANADDREPLTRGQQNAQVDQDRRSGV